MTYFIGSNSYIFLPIFIFLESKSQSHNEKYSSKFPTLHLSDKFYHRRRLHRHDIWH